MQRKLFGILAILTIIVLAAAALPLRDTQTRFQPRLETAAPGSPPGEPLATAAVESVRDPQIALAGGTPNIVTPEPATVTKEGMPPRRRLAAAFRQLTPDQAPTGILLDKGAISAKQLILRQDGSGTAPAVSRFEHRNAYGDLLNAAVSLQLPSPQMLEDHARVWREREHATPISLMILDYDTLGDAARAELSVDDSGVIRLPSGRLGESRRYVAAAAQAETVNYYNPTLVVASDLFVSNAGAAGDVKDLTIRFAAGDPVPAAFDTPIKIPQLPQESGFYELTVAFSLEAAEYSTKAVVSFNGAGPGGPTTPPPLDPVGCNGGIIWVDGKQIRYYDLPQVVAAIPYSDPSDPPDENPLGTLNIRVYPGNGTVENMGDGMCRINLEAPIVAIDGFDYSNTRTQESIWNDFSKGFLKFLQWGFDVITVDYTNGRDWIQRNGYAVRELLVNGLDDIVDPTVLAADRVIVIGGSMGSQTGRWALRTAELADEDHNTGLAIYFDGPFRGANIPISLHAALDWGAQVFPGLDTFLEGLNSRAAVQQLIRTRFSYGSGSTIWYQRHPQGLAYYAQVDSAEFGLPRRCRNVTVASGSGTGSLQNDGSVQKLIYLDDSLWKNFWGVGVKATAKTDFAVSSPIYDIFPVLRPAVFYGRADDRILFDWIDLGMIPGGVRQLRVALSEADYLDIAPGGWRDSPRDIMDAAADMGLAGKIHSDLEVHGFPPTYSALGIVTTDTHYNPSADPEVSSKILFDSFFWEKCNRRHAEITDHALGFAMREIAAFCDGEQPPAPALFQTPCGQPEPRDLCMGLVTWFSDPAAPQDIFPWYDGANCYVTPVPEGCTGIVLDNNYYVEAPVDCPAGSTAGEAGCLLATLPFAGHSSVIHQLDADRNLVIVSLPLNGGDHLGPIDCPEGLETLDERYEPAGDTYVTVCKVTVPAGHSEADLTVSSGGLYLQVDAQCPIGKQAAAAGELLCYLGSAPEDMKAFVWPDAQGAFYYDGLD